MSIEINDEVTGDIANILYSGYLSVKVFSDVQNAYKLHKEEKADNLSCCSVEIKVLKLLSSLGFPMDHPGTFLFKDLVLKVFYIISLGNKRIREQVITALENPYSAFYFDLARNELDLGIKSFHEFVSDAYNKIDGNNADFEIAAFFDGIYDQGNVALLVMGICDFIRMDAQEVVLGL